MSTNTTTTTTITAGRWAIEPARSEIGFTVRHLGLSKVRGRFNSFSGTVDIVDQLHDSTIEVLIDLSSVDTNNDQRDGHLRSTDFFDLETHPQMTFASTSVETSGSAGIAVATTSSASSMRADQSAETPIRTCNSPTSRTPRPSPCSTPRPSHLPPDNSRTATPSDGSQRFH